ncbi:hypothetical protein [Sphingosinicella sp. CPCC 101087]|uniref:hypothetical protein n=1 Tax=Sphingosinicella sp. CPCC 101087 TaxID=2497754 RepID=UPI00101CF23F|nr:hypothetical protein [Sphingosinicella sp. CPCC 101087]
MIIEASDLREGYGMMRLVRLASLFLLVPVPAALAQPAPEAPGRAADLADFAAGNYVGDVISDARGSSRSDVAITVQRVGPNLVEVSSNYSRIPTVRIQLTQAMSAVVAEGSDHVFLIQRDSDPDQLSLTIDDASLSVRRRRD